MKGKPVTGGIVSVLQFIGMMLVLLAFFGGAFANLSLGDEVVLLVSASITSVFIFAAAAIIQELRNITFNTLRADGTEAVPASPPVNRGAEPSSAHNVGGLQ